MNVIVVNKAEEMVANLEIEVVKKLKGVYKADEIVDNFANFFFGKMILDITAIEDYHNIVNLQKITIALPVEKIIVVLPSDDAEVNSPSFMSKLISLGIYNFAHNISEINYLLMNTNSYRDVAHLHQVDEPLIVEKNVQGPVREVIKEKIVEKEVPVYQYVDREVFHSQPVSSIILGVKNLTRGAGSTTICYLMEKELKRRGIPSVLIEAGREDLTYYNDKELISVAYNQLASVLLKYRNFQVIVVDLNDYTDVSICTDVIYLLEPSLIKINELIMKDSKVFERLQGKKIVVTKSLLSQQDKEALEYEAKTEFFDYLPPINDRLDTNPEINELLTKLGII